MASLVAQRIKHLPAKKETRVRSLGWEDPLEEEGMATHSSILAWRILMDRGAWRATVHRVSKSRTRLSYFTHMNSYICQDKETWEMGVGRNQEVGEKEGWTFVRNTFPHSCRESYSSNLGHCWDFHKLRLKTTWKLMVVTLVSEPAQSASILSLHQLTHWPRQLHPFLLWY